MLAVCVPRRSSHPNHTTAGHEALRRLVAGEPLRRVHECVFAVLAREREPLDPRR
jgi:hypothetical protein